MQNKLKMYLTSLTYVHSLATQCPADSLFFTIVTMLPYSNTKKYLTIYPYLEKDQNSKFEV